MTRYEPSIIIVSVVYRSTGISIPQQVWFLGIEQPSSDSEKKTVGVVVDGIRKFQNSEAFITV